MFPSDSEVKWRAGDVRGGRAGKGDSSNVRWGVTFCVAAVAAGCAVVWRDTFGANIWLAIGLQMSALGEEPSGRAHRAEGSASAQPAQAD